MFKLLKKLKTVDWLLLGVLVVFVFGQVYFDVELATYTQNVMEEMTDVNSTTGSILAIGGIMLLFALGSMLCTIVVGMIASLVSSRLSFSLRHDLFKKVQAFSPAETDKFSTAGLITRTTNDVQQVQMATLMFLRVAVSAPVTAVWAILRIKSTSGALTMATAAWVIALVAVFGVVFGIVTPRFKSVQRLNDRLNGVTRENLTGLRVVRAYNAEKFQEGKFSEVNDKLTDTHIFITRMLAFVSPCIMLVMNGIILTVYWYGASLINETKLLTYPQLVSFANLAMQVLSAFMMLSMLIVFTPRASVSISRILEVLETPLSVVDKEQKTPITCEKGALIEFEGVSFKYPGAEGNVLEGITFTAKPGQTVAVIGSTGSGKTTLVNLIPRLFDCTEGSVKICGVDVRDTDQKQLRSMIGFVPQRGLLFSGTVAENIAFGGEITEEKIVEAARVACADGFISEKEEGYGSNISQGGKNVSGGQRQRLSIARAVAVEPKIFVFDDSFSALDYKTDRTVRSNLSRLTGEATKIIVAQRIGTIKDADNILVLDKGRIVGQGTHGELLQSCETYRQIALSQLSREELGL